MVAAVRRVCVCVSAVHGRRAFSESGFKAVLSVAALYVPLRFAPDPIFVAVVAPAVSFNRQWATGAVGSIAAA